MPLSYIYALRFHRNIRFTNLDVIWLIEKKVLIKNIFWTNTCVHADSVYKEHLYNNL